MSGWSHSAIDTRPTRLACGRAARAICEDPIRRERPHGQVVVAGPAEPAQVRAAAHDFDQQARSELGVGREDARARRVEPIGGLDRGLWHDRAARPIPASARSRRPGRDRRSARRRGSGCRSRATSTAGRGARADRGCPPPRTRRRAPGTSSSASPAAITSANGASGSGLTNVTAPPMTIERIARDGAAPRAARAPPAGAS